MVDQTLISDIIIPISMFLGGAIISHVATAKQYKKKITILIEPEKTRFKIYNTGNAGLAIKQIGIGNQKMLWYSQTIDKTLTVDADPMLVPYDETDFWLKIESARGGKEVEGKIYCYVLSATNKMYKTSLQMNFSDLWAYHESYWGRTPDEVEESDLPF